MKIIGRGRVREAVISEWLAGNFVRVALTVSGIWAALVFAAWALLSFLWDPPSLAGASDRISTFQIALGLSGAMLALFPIYAGLRELQLQRMSSKPWLELRFDGRVAPERLRCDAGASFSWPVPAFPRIELVICNDNEKPARQIAVEMTGNANVEFEPSVFFSGEMREPHRVQWFSAPGAILWPKVELANHDGSVIDRPVGLDLGYVTWNRDEGIYWAEILVFLDNAPAPVSFHLSLSPPASDSSTKPAERLDSRR